MHHVSILQAPLLAPFPNNVVKNIHPLRAVGLGGSEQEVSPLRRIDLKPVIRCPLDLCPVSNKHCTQRRRFLMKRTHTHRCTFQLFFRLLAVVEFRQLVAIAAHLLGLKVLQLGLLPRKPRC